jgi:plasmid maintenance system killer protein
LAERVSESGTHVPSPTQPSTAPPNQKEDERKRKRKKKKKKNLAQQLTCSSQAPNGQLLNKHSVKVFELIGENVCSLTLSLFVAQKTRVCRHGRRRRQA